MAKADEVVDLVLARDAAQKEHDTIEAQIAAVKSQANTLWENLAVKKASIATLTQQMTDKAKEAKAPKA